MSKRKLLLADDSVTIQKVVNLTFADEGVDVITVGDGDSAMQKLAETEFDIILADVNMPGPSGYEICRNIRENEATRDLPVVLLVGSFEPFDEAEAARVGANAYMTKPFQSIRQLVSQVSDLMESARAKKIDPEVPPEPEVQTEAPETDDIESLYQRSVAETVEIPGLESGSRDYVDAGMDDEMIETSYSGPGHDAGIPDLGFAAAASGEHFGGAETEMSHDGNEHAAEFRDSGFESAVEQPVADFAIAQVAESLEETAAPFDQFAETERIAHEDAYSQQETVEMPQFARSYEENAFQEPEKSSDDVFKFDEIDLLELPPAGSAKTVEFTTPEGAIDAGSNKQVVSISPELMDIIVRKVAEKLSEKY